MMRPDRSQRMPQPWNSPQLNSPTYFSPVQQYRYPFPCFQYSQTSPKYISPCVLVIFTWPISLPSIHSPSYFLPLGSTNTPRPVNSLILMFLTSLRMEVLQLGVSRIWKILTLSREMEVFLGQEVRFILAFLLNSLYMFAYFNAVSCTLFQALLDVTSDLLLFTEGVSWLPLGSEKSNLTSMLTTFNLPNFWPSERVRSSSESQFYAPFASLFFIVNRRNNQALIEIQVEKREQSRRKQGERQKKVMVVLMLWENRDQASLPF